MFYPGKAITDQYPYRALCGRRLENDLPFASTTGGTTHTCFEDTVLVPLASWVFLVAVLCLFVYSITNRRTETSSVKAPWHRLIVRKASNGTPLAASDKSTEEASLQKRGTTFATRHHKLVTFFSILYSLLVLATLLMNVLEIVRLYLADRGAGLLPFTLVALLLVLILTHIPLPSHLRPATGIVLLIFWYLSVIFTAVKVATLVRLEHVESRALTEYLVSDQILDVSVYLGLYVLATIVESVRMWQLWRRSV